MPKIKLTKGELKRQRDSLKQYQRYLPTLQLKKQQLQLEILHQASFLGQKQQAEAAKRTAAGYWSKLLSDPLGKDFPEKVKPGEVVRTAKNIAGVDLPVFQELKFESAECDLFQSPLWFDGAAESLKQIFSLRAEIKVIQEGIGVLKRELRITTQRVNLFEKVKIPQAQEAIRLIKIYIGDQMTNAVGRSKIAKRKIEELALEGAAV